MELRSRRLRDAHRTPVCVCCALQQRVLYPHKEKTAINSAGEVRKSAARNRRRPAQRAFSSCALFFSPRRLPWFPHCAHPLSGTAFALAAGQPDRRMRGPPAICILFPGVVFPPPRHPASPLRLLIPDRRPSSSTALRLLSRGLRRVELWRRKNEHDGCPRFFRSALARAVRRSGRITAVRLPSLVVGRPWGASLV